MNAIAESMLGAYVFQGNGNLQWSGFCSPSAERQTTWTSRMDFVSAFLPFCAALPLNGKATPDYRCCSQI
jgi:hypothetical protein